MNISIFLLNKATRLHTHLLDTEGELPDRSDPISILSIRKNNNGCVESESRSYRVLRIYHSFSVIYDSVREPRVLRQGDVIVCPMGSDLSKSKTLSPQEWEQEKAKALSSK